jgi:hypothetical protein
VPVPNARQALAALLPPLPALAVPVVRDSTEPAVPIRADFKIIDDTSPADADATAAMLTFGGGTPGNQAALASFIPAGERGAIAVYFEWLCRMAVRPLEIALQLPKDSFDITSDRCSLRTPAVVDKDQDVRLTEFVLSLEDGYIGIKAKVTKSGFCYEASGDVSARLLLKVEHGRLIASVEVGAPNVDLDIPWYCWVAGAVIGAVIGGVLLGVIGSLIGGVLIPLILWIATDVVEKTIDDAARKVADAINQISPNVDVPAFGVNIVFQEVFVDDVVIQASFDVQDHAPIRCQGSVRLFPGQALDLDTGSVTAAEAAPGDVRWLGAGDGRRLETGCAAMLARTGRTTFDGLARFQLYGLPYQAKTAVPLWELGTPDAWGILKGDPIDETRTVLAVHTNRGRYAVVQATQLDLLSWVDLSYRTWDSQQPTLAIRGGFACGDAIRVPADAVATFRPALAAGGEARHRMVTAGRPLPEPARGSRVFPVAPVYQGTWLTEVEVPGEPTAVLQAVGDGFQGTVAYRWSIGGEAIEDGASGQRTVLGHQVTYAAKGASLTVTVAGGGTVELFVQVTATGGDGTAVEASTCLVRPARCKAQVRQVPTWAAFRELQQLANEVVATGLVSSRHGRLQQAAGQAPLGVQAGSAARRA